MESNAVTLIDLLRIKASSPAYLVDAAAILVDGLSKLPIDRWTRTPAFRDQEFLLSSFRSLIVFTKSTLCIPGSPFSLLVISSRTKGFMVLPATTFSPHGLDQLSSISFPRTAQLPFVHIGNWGHGWCPPDPFT
jgi:hypothetical protein